MSNIQSVSIISAFPIGIIMIVMIWSFIKDAGRYIEELQRNEKWIKEERSRIRIQNF